LKTKLDTLKEELFNDYEQEEDEDKYKVILD